MTATCLPLPVSSIHALFQDMGRALCDRPGQTAAEQEARTWCMVHAILGLQPRDGLEFMLSGMATGHFHLILDSMRDVFQGQIDTMKARTKAGIVALDRAMLSLLKELRMSQTRPVAEEARDATRPAAAAPEARAGTQPAPATPEETFSPLAEPSPEAVTQARRLPESGEEIPSSVPPPLPPDAETRTTEENIAAFEDALRALSATLEEARAHDPPGPAAQMPSVQASGITQGTSQGTSMTRK